MKPITLKQIAETLGLSVATVSKALRNYPDVSEKNKKRVNDLARSLNYVPNPSAVNLRTHKSKTIGVIIPATVHNFFSNVINGILEIAEKEEYLVILMQSNENYELEKRQVDLLINKNVDGILMALSNKTNNFSHIQKILDFGIPLTLFDKISKSINCSKVIIDDRTAAYNAVTHLIKKGHRKIAHFRGDLIPQNSIDRFLGYKQALIDNDIAYDSSLVFMCNNNNDFDDGYNAAKKLYGKFGNSIDAIFCITDVVATGALKYFKDNNIKVPEDIALFGFSDWFMSSVITPALSTVHQPGYEMGKESAKILFSEIDNKFKGKPISYKTVILDTNLVIRESC
ncbi:MAG TPA: LacI family DNA-binding transcriptional regulator [Flavobacteriaceae bacterium]|nr:LacI family DNA-binding transcriptional regulator [Flavobacteriaceae bacterium]